MTDSEKKQVLFICRHNSCRSQMAEALLRHRAGNRFEVFSAGLESRDIHPLVPDVLHELGIDPSDLRSQPITDYLGRLTPHYAIIVCDINEDECPSLYPFTRDQLLHWPFEDPSEFEGSRDETRQKFRAVRDRIDRHIQDWIG